MYTPAVFREPDVPRLHALIEARAFGLLLVPSAAGCEIAHLPFVLDRAHGEQGRLRVHVARANPIWKQAEGAPVVAVFSGAHGYVSPRWYEHPDDQVPTWNYLAVHAHGTASILTGDELLALVDDLAAIHERGAAEPWTTSRLPKTKRDQLLSAIVGLSIPIARIEGKAKLSQNRSPEDRRRVALAFEARGTEDDLAMSGWMKQL